MVERRPYPSAAQLLDTADHFWSAISVDGRYEAFAHHPRIGETKSAAEQSLRAREWSEGEQSRARGASSGVFDQMALVNQAYEKKFGFTYIVSAAGKTADDLLNMARARLKNDRDTELRVATEEQRIITRLRLQKLIGEDAS